MAEYDLYFTNATKGMIADTTAYTIDSFFAEEFVPFGVAVRRGTNADEVAIWDAAITVPFLGVAIYDPSNNDQTTIGNNNIGYEAGSQISIMRVGRVFVEIDSGVTVVPGDKAYLEATTGNFTNVATNNLLIGTFENNAVAGTSLAILYIK